MARQRMLIGEVAAAAGVSRKAIRLYEAHGILPPPARTDAGYRMYGEEVVDLLRFFARARRLGFGLDEIREIVAIRRAGLAPCDHVRDLAAQRLVTVERTLRELAAQRRMLRDLLASRPARDHGGAVFCPHIECNNQTPNGRRRR